MSARSFSSSSRRRSFAPVVESSAFCQSTARPSEIEVASTVKRCTSSGSFKSHLLGQPDEGPPDRHARRVGCRLTKGVGHLRIAEVHLDARHDCLTVLCPQSLERLLVALHH